MDILNDLADKTGRPMNCLFIVPSLRRAGAESQLIDLVNRLDSARFQKTVVVLEGHADQMDKLDRQSVEVVVIPKKSRLDLGQVKKIAKLIDDRSIELVHATIQYSVFIAWLARLMAKNKPKLVAVIHTTKNVGTKEEFFDRFLYRQVLRACDHIIFVCRYQREYWISRFPEVAPRSSVIHNGVDPEAFRREDYEQQGRELLDTLGITPDRFIIACVAGFRKEKGHDILIEAFSGLPQPAALMLAGDGVMRKQMEEFTLERGVKDRVHFLGNLPDVRPLLAVSDILVLASTSETFSMAMLEAMSMKVPVVASNIGGLGEAIEDGVTGRLVVPGDSENLRDAIRQYIQAPDETLTDAKERCRDTVLASFTSEIMTIATENCLLSVLKGKQSPDG